MGKFILGKKLGSSQIFKEDGTVMPVTVIEAGPCIVTQVKTKKKDDYEAELPLICLKLLVHYL